MTNAESAGAIRKTASPGFSLIEVLVSLAVFSIGVAAITTAIIAASGTSRTTARADQSILRGQEVLEQLAAMPMDAPVLQTGGTPVIDADDRKIELEVFDPVDADGDGHDDYKTIYMRVLEKKGDDYQLRMENFFRKSLP